MHDVVLPGVPPSPHRISCPGCNQSITGMTEGHESGCKFENLLTADLAGCSDISEAFELLRRSLPEE